MSTPPPPAGCLSQAQLNLILEVAAQGLWCWDIATDRIIWVGEFARLFGFPRAQFDGTPAMLEARTQDRAWSRAILHRAPSEDPTFDCTYRVVWPDDSLHWLHARGRMEYDSHGQPVRVLGITREVTQKRREQQRLTALAAVIDNSEDIIVVKDLDLRVIATNPAFARVAGHASAEVLIGRTDAEIFGVPPDSEPVRSYMADERAAQRLAPGESLLREEPVLCADGHHRHYLTHKYPIFDDQGALLGTGNISIDISQRRELEEQLRATNQQLTEAVACAERAARAKDDFLAHMSHEIRTPMNAILGLAELALRQPLNETTHSYLSELHQSGEHLLGILNDILDQSKIEAGQLRLEEAPFDREALLESERSLFAPMAQAKGLALEVSADHRVPAWLIGDVLRLRQVLTNLLSNAIKFTDSGQVSLRVDCLGCDAHQARLRWTVADTGIGMSALTRDRLFQPFAQGDDSIARRFGGTGLGLSISQHLVELMGGRLEMSSTPDVGSRFSFDITLALAEAPALSSVSAPLNALDLSGRRILVAEDQPINQRIITDMLQMLGAEVTLASDGQEALKCLYDAVEDAFDLVLMDVQMPQMDGLSATQHLRAHQRWAQLPVIALTAGVTTAERERAREAGMNAVLAKPLSLQSLTQTLAHWLPLHSEHLSQPPPAPQPLSAGASIDFDFAHLCELLGDPAEVRDILQQFAASIRDHDAQMVAALGSGDWENARHLAHRLRGAAANVGANALSAAAERLEAGLEASLDPEAEVFQAFQRVYRRTLAQIHDMDAEDSTGSDHPQT